MNIQGLNVRIDQVSIGESRGRDERSEVERQD